MIGTVGQDAGVINQGNLRSWININIIDGTLNFEGLRNFNIDMTLLDSTRSDPVSLFRHSSITFWFSISILTRLISNSLEI